MQDKSDIVDDVVEDEARDFDGDVRADGEDGEEGLEAQDAGARAEEERSRQWVQDQDQARVRFVSCS